MFEHFKAHLDRLVTPEQGSMMLEAVEAIHAAGYERIEFLVDQELAVQDNLGADLAFTFIEQILRPTFDHVLGEFGIEMYDQAPIPMMTAMVQALDGLDNFDDVQSLLAIANSDETSEEIVAELIGFMTDIKADDMLEQIVEVRPSLVERIRTILVTIRPVEGDEEQPDDTLRLMARDRVRLYLTQIPEAQWLRDLVTDGLPLGMPFTVLYAQHQLHPLELAERDTQKALVDYIGLFMASGQLPETIQDEITNFIGAIASDINVSTKLAADARRILDRLAG